MFLLAMIAAAVLLLPPVWGVVALAFGIVVEVAEIGFWVRFLRRYRVATGAEGLIGTPAEVVEACDPRGRVRLRGEIWHARCDAGAAIGDRVAVTGVHGLTLHVEPENGKGPR